MTWIKKYYSNITTKNTQETKTNTPKKINYNQRKFKCVRTLKFKKEFGNELDNIIKRNIFDFLKNENIVFDENYFNSLLKELDEKFSINEQNHDFLNYFYTDLKIFNWLIHYCQDYEFVINTKFPYFKIHEDFEWFDSDNVNWIINERFAVKNDYFINKITMENFTPVKITKKYKIWKLKFLYDFYRGRKNRKIICDRVNFFVIEDMTKTIEDLNNHSNDDTIINGSSIFYSNYDAILASKLYIVVNSILSQMYYKKLSSNNTTTI